MDVSCWCNIKQTDHLLIDRRHKSNLMDVRSCLSASIDSNHYLGIAHIGAEISNVKKVTGIRTSKYNVYKLVSSEVAEQYRQQMISSIILHLLNRTMEKNCGRDIKQSLILWLRRSWALWNWRIKERGLLLNARLPQKTKTKYIGRCNKDMVPEAK